MVIEGLCPNCGSEAGLIGLSGITDVAGVRDQGMIIACSEKNFKYCPVMVEVRFDPDGVKDLRKVKNLLIDMWNRLSEIR